MGLVLMLVAAVKVAWGWVSPIVGAIVAEVLLTRFRRRRLRARREASRERHQQRARRSH